VKVKPVTDWHQKYWDTVDQLYWTPSMLGLASIPRAQWGDDPDRIVIDRAQLSSGASLYTRKGTARTNLARMRRLEEPLNHIFDITFAIAACAVIERMFAGPLGFGDPGPFLRIGREIETRFPDSAGNSTQQDAFYVSDRSLIGVELKLGSKTWPGQVLKYLSLMVAEERLTGRRDQIGLLFITPDAEASATFACAGLDAAGKLPAGFVGLVPPKQRNRFIDRMMDGHGAHFDDIASRLVCGHLSWRQVRDSAMDIADEARQAAPANETLYRLLSGFGEAIAHHGGTGMP
jgi:hypothetical protein